MANFDINSKRYDFTALNQPKAAADKATPAGTDSGGFAAQLAAFKSQNFNTLLTAAFDAPTDSGLASVDNGSAVGGLFGTQQSSGSGDFLSALTSSRQLAASKSVSGLNMSLFDPQAGYDMMSLINKKDVLYQAQYAELNKMGDALKTMQKAGEQLAGIGPDSSNADIKAKLQDFAQQYNQWVKDFNTDMQSGGVLADTQAAKVARYELAQSIGSIFHGAVGGVQGMSALGLSVDPGTGLASLDAAKLDATLAQNRQGVLGAVKDFSGNFTEAAKLLNEPDNFIPRQLDNLGRAIHFIADNKSAWQTEFGQGDAYTASGQVAQALAAYKQLFA
ncbi:flagellar filament capping protein FliD [Chitinimonas sp.]|uniref:flagellar filament capping protein FliD n=1 Tax=Chitinimonas sp. TaxID=1934313 RepID=UPI002F92A547